jgi:hypothetical protein
MDLNLLAIGAGHHRLFQEANRLLVCWLRLGPRSRSGNLKARRGISPWLSQPARQCRATRPAHRLKRLDGNERLVVSYSKITVVDNNEIIA